MTDEQHINGVPVRPRIRTEYDEFYDRESGPGDDYTWGEVVWKGATKAVWANVFQILSDRPDMATRELIRQLEAAREADGAGPLTN